MSPFRFVLVAVSLLGSITPSPFVSTGSVGRVLHVSPSGDDDASGTRSDPWRTLHWSFRRLTPGDTLIVHGGTYRGTAGWRPSSIPDATADRPILVQAAPGERPVLKGVINMTRPSFWTFDGLNITRDPDRRPVDQYLFKVTDGVGWVFRNGEIWGGEGVSNVLINGTRTNEPRNWRFVNNCVHDVGDGRHPMNYHNMYVTPGYGSGSGLIARNVFFGVPNGNHIKAAGPDSSTGAAQLKIRHNTMHKASQGVVVAYRSHHVVLKRNLVVGRWGGRVDNPGFRGHELRNRTNFAQNNAAWGYGRVILNTQASGGRLRDAGGNVKVKPVFNDTGTCGGYVPTNKVAKAYGHLAP